MLPADASPASANAAPAPSTAPVGWRSVLAAGLLIFLYFSAWALLRPPLQTPDEPQHLLKANAILLQPWRSAPGRFELDPRRVNPLALDTPAALDKLFFRSFNAMTREDIATMQAAPWPDRSGPPTRIAYERAIASYPSLYYLAVHALSEPIIAALDLSPWQATYTYRLATAALTAPLWALVWLLLRRTPDTSALATPMLLLTLATPMLAFISSGTTPDAVNNALCALGLLLAWRAATLGTDRVALFLTLLAAALTKPSGLQLAGLLAGVLTLFVLAGQAPRRRAIIAIALAAAAGVLSVVAFYHGTPPRFMAGGPSHDSLFRYLVTRAREADLAWRLYWGQLGWMEYGLPMIGHLPVMALVAVNAAIAIARPRRPARFAVFAALVWLAFTAVTFAGEYHYLDVAGYTFQGRYLLPVALAFAVVLWHDQVWARRALIAAVIVLNVLLVEATVTRYYVDRWSGLWQSLPVHASRP